MADTIFKYVSLANLQKYDEKIKQHIADADTTLKTNLESQVTVVANALDGEIARAKAAEQANATAASNAQTAVDTLETYVGTFTHATAKTVVEYVNAKTDGIATSSNLEALAGRVTQAEKDIDAIEVDYLKAADKTELQNNINTVSGAVERLTNGVSAEEIDGVNDLIQYVKDHGTEVTGIKGDIAQNATDIAGVAGRMDTAEGKIEDLEDAVAAKVEQSVYDEKIAALEGADTGLGNRITALEGKFGGADGSVEDMIADAKAEAIATADTNAANKDAVVLSEAQKYADAEDAKIEARVDALEAIEHHDHANKAELDLIETGDKAKWDAAAAKAHEHGNKTVLDGITAENITTWNTVTSKAAQADLEAAVARIAANEADIAAFIEVSEQEILDLFA